MLNYYAVLRGRTPGIYLNWDDCKAQTAGYSGAIYKKFKTLSEAQAFMKQTAETSEGTPSTAAQQKKAENDFNHDLSTLSDMECLAYVDGSFHAASGCYGYGTVLLTNKGILTFQGNGNDPELASMRNVTGELYGSMRAVEEAIRLGFSDITIFHDYMGIACWANGSWKTNKEGTRAYRNFILEKQKLIRIHFHKVTAHTGVRYNEMADQLAKEAVGIL